jgi:hypothetical protein
VSNAGLSALVAIMLVGSLAGFVWLIKGPVGQRGRAIRAERGGKPNGPFVASMIAVVVIVVALIATRNR